MSANHFCGNLTTCYQTIMQKNTHDLWDQRTLKVARMSLSPLDLFFIGHLEVDEDDVLQELGGQEVVLLLSQHLAKKKLQHQMYF